MNCYPDGPLGFDPDLESTLPYEPVYEPGLALEPGRPGYPGCPGFIPFLAAEN